MIFYKKIRGPFLSLFVLGLCLINPVKADVNLSDIEKYLEGLNIEGTFKQWDSNGALTTGTLYLKQPGRLRMTYREPSKLLILADGKTFFLVDRATGDISYSALKHSPASFLLGQNINFDRDFHIKEFSIEANKVTLTLTKKHNDDGGSLTLVFEHKPAIQLSQWIIIDAHLKKTIINLENIKKDVNLTPSLFDSSILLP